MINKKVLVVVCAYNEQNSIFNCLDSLRKSIENNCLLSNYSVVCVDNFSTDKTGEIASNFARNNKGFNYIKIEHCNLCVSRNIYKNFNGFDFVAYIDGDGYVSESWAKNLNKIIECNPGVNIISGPVLDLESKSENLIWDMYFDSSLYSGANYLIGANMIFSIDILNRVDGFPCFFPVRGDESSLLLRINNVEKNINHIFDNSLVAYNYFPSDLKTFIKTQYYDGQRSHDISQLSGNYLKTKTNGIVKILSISLLMSTPVFVTVEPILGFISFSISIGPFAFRHRKYIKSVISKIKSSKQLRYATAIIMSRYLFDAGFISRFFDKKKVKKEMLNITKNPIVLEKVNG
ncbi:glycosyltransferase family 2 protein [Vibrio fluvialis]|nr:glycosyltransferase family 2 protein [Vibrio fluvialis]